jgi:hypothetical protein
LFSEAFSEQPVMADYLEQQDRYNAARAAILSGGSQGKDADKLDAKERARLRRQALDWLLADLKAYQQMMEQSRGTASPMIVQRMQYWLQEGDFALVRGHANLSQLPEAEIQEWQKLWQEVEVLKKRAAEHPSSVNTARP